VLLVEAAVVLRELLQEMIEAEFETQVVVVASAEEAREVVANALRC